MLDSKTKARIAQDSRLPTHDDCEAKKKTAPLSALERFIYDQEPVEDGEWRDELKAAIIEAREAEATRAAGLVEALRKLHELTIADTEARNIIRDAFNNYNNPVNK